MAMSEEKRLAKLQAEAPQRTAKFFEENGFGSDGRVFIVLGNTYPIKEELKEKGARYHEFLGWHFAEPVEGYPLLECNPDTIIGETEDKDGNTVPATLLRVCYGGELGWQYDWTLYHIWLKKVRYEYAHRDVQDAGYFGKVKDRVSITVKCRRVVTYETEYSYYGEVQQTFVFEDEDGHVFIWRTGTLPNIEEGDKIELIGTVKEHTTYYDTKRTVLTRCRIIGRY